MNHDMLLQINKSVRLYTDGSCLMHHQHRPGGWAFCITDAMGEVLHEDGGGLEASTNNQMELLAAIQGLQYCAQNGHKDVLLIADSKYVTTGVSAWLKGWVKRGWRTADGSPVANRDLWVTMHQLTQQLNIRAVWVKGHSGDHFNERVDKMALAAAHDLSEFIQFNR